MAKRKGKGKFRAYQRGIVNVEQAFGALGPKVLAGQDFPEVVVEKTWCSSIDVAWTLSNVTPVADAGPILVGVAHNDYTNAEVEEFLENVNSWDRSDLVQSREIGKRFVRQIGIFEMPDSVTDSVRLNDGRKIHTKIGWMLQSGQTLKMFSYNLGAVGMSGASAPNVAGRGVAHLWPT